MEIFIADPSNEKRLEDVFHVLKFGLPLEGLLEGESSNYAEGIYFQAFLKGKGVKLYYLDTEGLEEWPFVLEFSEQVDSLESVAIQISELGFECFVPHGEWYLKTWDKRGKHYMP